jgi:glycosyltransferase involved in cell wall biosynthesis
MVSEHASPLAVLGGVDAGGQNVHVAALARALADQGHVVTVYTRRDDADLPAEVPLAPGVLVRHVDAGPPARVAKDDLLPWVPALADGLAEAWRRDRPDLVHSHFWMSGLAATAAVRALAEPLPVVHTYHALGVVKRRQQGAADTSPPGRVELEARLGQEVDLVLATCSDEAAELGAMGVPDTKIAIAPCGVDLGVFSPSGPAEPRGERHRIGVVGRMVPRKGMGLAITALGMLAARGRDDLELVVVGGPGGPEDLAGDAEARRLMQLAESCGVRDRVEFRGQVPQAELPAVLRSLDAVVCAPWYEPFGITALEAMACEVPVIAAAVGGLIDTVVDQVTGLHVPPRDPAAIARAVEQIVDHPHASAALGRAGRSRVCSRYSWDRVAGETARVYADALQRWAAGAGRAELDGCAEHPGSDGQATRPDW